MDNIIWLVMLFSVFAVDFVVIIAGWMMWHHVPKDRYGSVGYKTKRSRQSEESWKYANVLAGKVFFVLGILITIPSVIIMIMIKGTTMGAVAWGIGLLLATSVIMCIPVIFIEKKLKEKFPEE